VLLKLGGRRVHYLVPRISEMHSWILDETVDMFGAGTDSVPSMMIFSGSVPLDNDLPAWKQPLAVPNLTELLGEKNGSKSKNKQTN
jgi:hypothetical protein